MKRTEHLQRSHIDNYGYDDYDGDDDFDGSDCSLMITIMMMLLKQFRGTDNKKAAVILQRYSLFSEQKLRQISSVSILLYYILYNCILYNVLHYYIT